MKQEEGFFSSFDGTPLFYRAWKQPAEQICLIFHGYGEHSGRYGELAQFLKSVPCSFFAFDLRGQGKSGGRRVHAEFFDDFIKDAEAFLQFLEKSGQKPPRQKLTIIGHSLGGLIAVRFVEKNESLLNRLVLSSPCFALAGLAAAPIVQKLTQWLGLISPNLRLDNMVKPRFLFHDQEENKRYFADSLIERKITARLAAQIIEACCLALSKKFHFRIPVFVMASGDDHIVSLDASKKWFERLDCERKRMKIYPGFFHELFHESLKMEPFEDLKHFLMEEGG